MRADLPGRAAVAAVIAGAVMLTSLGSAPAAGRKALPVDEAGTVPALTAMRAALLEAVVGRDVDGIVAQAAPDIQLSFGGHAGHDELRRFLNLSAADLADEYKHEADSRRDAYWAALEEVLRMGGRFTGPDVFEAPYTVTVELAESDDPYTTYFVIGAGVPLRSRPSPHGAVVATLDYDIVTAASGGEAAAYRKVTLAGGVSGYVESALLRSPAGHRAAFERRDGRWQMVLFLAGD